MTDVQINSAHMNLLLTELRLPGVKAVWEELSATADKEGWPAARFLSALAEHEISERDIRRIGRVISNAKLPPGKTLDNFDYTAVPMLSKSHVNALASSEDWLDSGDNILIFGPPGVGKSHLSSAIGRSLGERGRRVLFTRTTELVQKLQRARRDLSLDSLLAKLDHFQLLILDDFTYASKDQSESSVLFELISYRYERRSMLLTANQPFSEWDKLFPERVMAAAAIDRLVHHATIFELNVESYRRREAGRRKRSEKPQP